MKRTLAACLLLLGSVKLYSQGCTVTGSVPRDTIVCGDLINLSAYGQGQGVALLTENFNSGSFGSGWSSTQQAMWNNPCGGSVDGTTYVWFGNSSPVPRTLVTQSFNLSSCAVAGVTICFDMKLAEQGDAAPCEGPDEPQEGIYLQYSTDNGTNWTTLNYFDPNGGYDPVFINWTNWCFPVPVAALTANTRFRWFQNADSGADYDHWGLDNIVIYCNDPTYNVVFTHDGYGAGPAGGTDPTPVAPHTTTSYEVVMSNGTTTCRDTVTVYVKSPQVVVNAGNDTTICAGDCATLHPTAKVVVSPAKVITYANNELTSIATAFGSTTDIGINVTSLNQTNVLPNAIQQVCISNVFFFGTGFGGGFPPQPVQIDISDLILSLECPSGQTITLVPANVTTGGSNPLSGGYTNTCFVPGAPNITTGTSPYTGNFAPNQPFNNLSGCTANGVWNLNVQMNSSFGFGSGTFSGWNITFDDPEISYTGDFNWNPTSNMTNSNTLTPTVCPPATATYTITMSDTAGCVTQSDDITVNVQQTCCNLSATFSTTQPNCGASNGSINVTPVPSGSYSFSWVDGPTSQNRTNLAAGTYALTITNTTDPTCTFDTTIILNSSSSLSASLTHTNPTCAGNSANGTATLTFTGGTAPYTITIDTGGTPITQTVPVNPGPYTVSNLTAVTVSVTIQDGSGCTASATTTLTAPSCTSCSIGLSASATQPSCGQANGSLTITAAPAGNYSYTWAGSLPSQNTQTSLAAGQYPVTVTNLNVVGCTKDTILTLNNSNGIDIAISNPVNPTCAGSDGAITMTLTGGTAPFVITVDTNGTPFTINLPINPGAQTISNLNGGIINVSVSDNAGCTDNASVTLTAPSNCCSLAIASVSPIPPSCGNSDGGIQITVTNGTGNYSYNWTGGATGATLSNIGAGTYNVTVTDNGQANCTVDTTILLTNPNAPVINNIAIVNETCPGTADGTATVNASGGAGSFQFLWSNSQTAGTATGLTSGNYSVTVTDAADCQTIGTVTVGADFCCTLTTSANVTPGSCNQANASITVNIETAGTSPYTYSIDGVNFQSSNIFTALAAGNYTITTRDDSGCEHMVTATVLPSSNVLNAFIESNPVSCAGDSNASATVYPNGGASPFTYVWNTGATSSGIINLPAGIYSVSVSDAVGCSGTASVMLNDPAPVSVELGNNIVICENQGVPMDTIGTYASYLWSNGETSRSINPRFSGVYSLTVTDANGCAAIDSIYITVHSTPNVNLGDDISAFVGSYLYLSADIYPSTAGGSYLWGPDSLITCPTCSIVRVTIVDSLSRTYRLTYTNRYGCSDTDEITIYVLQQGNVYFPNTFTPNGDGINDTYKPYGHNIKNVSFKIFNRWGEKVFESSTENIGWDGTFKGEPLSPGIYTYSSTVTFLDETQKEFKGGVTLLK